MFPFLRVRFIFKWVFCSFRSRLRQEAKPEQEQVVGASPALLQPSRSSRIAFVCSHAMCGKRDIRADEFVNQQPKALKPLPGLGTYGLCFGRYHSSLLRFKVNCDWKWETCVNQLVFYTEGEFSSSHGDHSN